MTTAELLSPPTKTRSPSSPRVSRAVAVGPAFRFYPAHACSREEIVFGTADGGVLRGGTFSLLDTPDGLKLEVFDDAFGVLVGEFSGLLPLVALHPSIRLSRLADLIEHQLPYLRLDGPGARTQQS